MIGRVTVEDIPKRNFYVSDKTRNIEKLGIIAIVFMEHFKTGPLPLAGQNLRPSKFFGVHRGGACRKKPGYKVPHENRLFILRFGLIILVCIMYVSCYILKIA